MTRGAAGLKLVSNGTLHQFSKQTHRTTSGTPTETHWLRHTTLTWIEHHHCYAIAQHLRWATPATTPETTTYVTATTPRPPHRRTLPTATAAIYLFIKPDFRAR